MHDQIDQCIVLILCHPIGHDVDDGTLQHLESDSDDGSIKYVDVLNDDTLSLLEGDSVYGSIGYIDWLFADSARTHIYCIFFLIKYVDSIISIALSA